MKFDPQQCSVIYFTAVKSLSQCRTKSSIRAAQKKGFLKEFDFNKISKFGKKTALIPYSTSFSQKAKNVFDNIKSHQKELYSKEGLSPESAQKWRSTFNQVAGQNGIETRFTVILCSGVYTYSLIPDGVFVSSVKSSKDISLRQMNEFRAFHV